MMHMNYVNPFSLAGRVAVVTGANTGLGQAMAIALAQAGADIVAVARSSAADTLASIKQTGRRGFEISADLSDKGAATAVIDAAVLQAGRVDILVNNAGIIRRADALDFTEADWDITLDVNLKAPFFLAQAAAREMLRHGGGKIINIVSMLSFQGGIRTASYTASKSALAGITRLLANEWAAKGINVNAIAPGYFATNNTTALRADEQRNKDILARIPAGRWGQPSDLGGAVVFLSSPASDYVHGTIVPVDGGWLAR
jgi:2-deoxy-D-gluconate 3-dehydrogenase